MTDGADTVIPVKNKIVEMALWSSDERQRIRIAGQASAGDSVVTILHSDYQWRKVRNIHVREEPYCQMCGIRKKLEAHHVVPWHLSPELRFERSNLITLCRDDHYRFGHFLHWKDMNPNIRELCEHAHALHPNIEEVGL
jgi:hypothetical protein